MGSTELISNVTIFVVSFNFTSLSTMVKPVTLACGHSSCQSCLATAFAMSSSPKCPLCKMVFPSGAALNVNIVLDDITSRMEITCTNSGWEWVGKLVSHSQHSNTCSKKRVHGEYAEGGNGAAHFPMREAGASLP